MLYFSQKMLHWSSDKWLYPDTFVLTTGLILLGFAIGQIEIVLVLRTLKAQR